MQKVEHFDNSYFLSFFYVISYYLFDFVEDSFGR